MRITPQMFNILKLHLQGLSPYKIARELNMDAPTVYASLKAAKTNFQEADKMLSELKAQGWPVKLEEVQQQIRSRCIRRQRPQPPAAEIALKLG